MYVKIGKYPNYLGPYQIAEKILFWIPKCDEQYQKSDTVYNFGKWLSQNKDGTESRLTKLCEWLHSFNKQKIKVRIDNRDVWNMDTTLCHIILPMLKLLKENKHGSPYVKDGDVPENIRSTSAKELTEDEKNNGHTDEFFHKRWEWVLDEMIFAFEMSHPDNDWEEEFRSGDIDFNSVPCDIDKDGKVLSYSLENGPKHTYKCDYDKIMEVEKRIANGHRLFGSYYGGLWT